MGKSRQQRWNERNRHIKNESQAWSRAKKANAIAPWAHEERSEMKELYREAHEKGLHVDHEVPLTDPDVCGLHCLANLRLLTPYENFLRSRKTWIELDPTAEVPF